MNGRLEATGNAPAYDAFRLANPISFGPGFNMGAVDGQIYIYLHNTLQEFEPDAESGPGTEQRTQLQPTFDAGNSCLGPRSDLVGSLFLQWTGPVRFLDPGTPQFGS